MGGGLATQLITVGATLSGVVLTMVGSMLLERRRAREAHRLESVRLAADSAKWLRDERMKAYAAFSLAIEDVLQFLRVPDEAERWPQLRADLRKAYNQVLLLGAEEPRAAALRVWVLARDSGEHDRDEVRGRIGGETNDFLKACRADLQNG